MDDNKCKIRVFFLCFFCCPSHFTSGYQLMNVLTHSAWLPSSKVFFFLTQPSHMGNFFFLLPDRSTWGKNNWPTTCKQGTIVEQPPRYSEVGAADSPSYVSWKWSTKSLVQGTFFLLCCCLRAWYCPCVDMKSFVTKEIGMWFTCSIFFFILGLIIDDWNTHTHTKKKKKKKKKKKLKKNL